MRQYLNKAELEHGQYYAGHCRNANVARWNGERQLFIHWRTKFGETFTEEIRHPEDEKHFDVFYPTHICVEDIKEIPLA
jgi:hypothetical protein